MRASALHYAKVGRHGREGEGCNLRLGVADSGQQRALPCVRPADLLQNVSISFAARAITALTKPTSAIRRSSNSYMYNT
jgi:hypothetical protein